MIAKIISINDKKETHVSSLVELNEIGQILWALKVPRTSIKELV